MGIVWGPPGTGKTTTLAEMVAALVSAGERVLVLAPTRIASDGACLAIDEAITRAKLSRARRRASERSTGLRGTRRSAEPRPAHLVR